MKEILVLCALIAIPVLGLSALNSIREMERQRVETANAEAFAEQFRMSPEYWQEFNAHLNPHREVQNEASVPQVAQATDE